jgi:hypothetical protein
MQEFKLSVYEKLKIDVLLIFACFWMMKRANKNYSIQLEVAGSW